MSHEFAGSDSGTIVSAMDPFLYLSQFTRPRLIVAGVGAVVALGALLLYLFMNVDNAQFVAFAGLVVVVGCLGDHSGGGGPGGGGVGGDGGGGGGGCGPGGGPGC